MTINTQSNSFTDGRIAICLSGGGYRAAAFHLGTMSYLARVNLLENIKSLSTVSGGTFIGTMYAVSLIQDLSFDQFYRQTCERLEKIHLVELALGLLGEKANNLSGRRNLIISMAEIYGQHFFLKPDNFYIPGFSFGFDHTDVINMVSEF